MRSVRSWFIRNGSIRLRRRFSRTPTARPRLSVEPLETRQLLSGGINQFPLPTPNPSPGDLYMGITAGPDGNLWYTREGANTVGRLTTSGVMTEFPVTGGPTGI